MSPDVQARLRIEASVLDTRKNFRDQVRRVLKDCQRQRDGETPEAAAERSFMVRHFRKNVETVETIGSMQDLIQEFKTMTPVLLVHKCIDGRVHGSKGKGYPPTTVSFLRTEGCKLDSGPTNEVFWGKVDDAELDAAHNTPGTPALFIALAHTAHEGHGCAAQSQPGLEPHQVVANSLRTVAEHAQKVRERYGNDRVYAMHGITNTDDMSETFIFENGVELSTATIIGETGLDSPENIFTSGFLSAPIDDASIKKHVGDTTVGALFSGDAPLVYNDLRSGIAMEVYLMKQISSGNTAIINPKVMKAVERILGQAEGLPESLRAPLIYQTIWNIAYTLYQRNKVKQLTGEARERQLEHAEELICYGEGFELLDRNEAVLAKTGRGDDREPLMVAKRVLDGNRKKATEAGHPQPHRPMVHVNVQIPGDITNWHQFNGQVLVKLKAMSDRVREVFAGEEVCIFTTYSYETGKEFFPVQVYPEALRNEGKASAFEADVSVGLNDSEKFAAELERREYEFTASFAPVSA